jgi:hypothetical protein
MKVEQIWKLITCEAPLDLLARHLMDEIWTCQALAKGAADDFGDYLRHGEQAASRFEKDIYDIYSDMYRLLEEPAHPRKLRIKSEILDTEQFTLVIFDALSLREVPALLEVFSELRVEVSVDYALSCVPSDTSSFAYEHFAANGPSAIANTLRPSGWAFRHVKKRDWQPDFAADECGRVIWALYPDDIFNLDHGAISYGHDIIAPVQGILRAILQADPVLPLVVTSDHGYIWQGDANTWGVSGDEERILAKHFKNQRCTTSATIDEAMKLASGTGGKAWVSDRTAAARGRFAWGGKVKGPIKLYKHGGVSLMECITPWLSVGKS